MKSLITTANITWKVDEINRSRFFLQSFHVADIPDKTIDRILLHILFRLWSVEFNFQIAYIVRRIRIQLHQPESISCKIEFADSEEDKSKAPIQKHKAGSSVLKGVPYEKWLTASFR